MIVGLLGDIHGRIDLALTGVLAWQTHMDRRFDLLLQVGDMGAFPSEARMDAATVSYLALDPTEADFVRMMSASGSKAEAFRRVRTLLSSPIHFIRGNHEDHAWLSTLSVDRSTGTASVDPFGILQYVPDGTVLELKGVTVAFLGGAQADDQDSARINGAAVARLDKRTARSVDLLVTHDCPSGIEKGHMGHVQGSTVIADLQSRVHPKFHVGGHYHISMRKEYSGTDFLCLNNIVASARWHPQHKGTRPGWLAVWDTRSGTLEPIADSVVTGIDQAAQIR